MPIVSSTIEQQIKSSREMMIDYLKIIEAIEKLREKEDAASKISPRGSQKLSPMEQGLI
jgi:hypothetical protein